jgi:hypothetical protein
MLIDRTIDYMENGSGTQLGGTEPAPVGELLQSLRRSRAYEVSDLNAWMRHLTKKGTAQQLIAEVMSANPEIEHSLERFMGRVIWIEDRNSGLIWFPGEGKALLVVEHDDGMEIKYSPATSQQLAHEADVVMHLIAYLAMKPIAQIVIAQQGRATRLNKRQTKTLKQARSEVRTVVIDGVERVFQPNGTFIHRVHSRGWHARRHEVAEHLRRYASGKVVRIEAHIRGDANLGYVPWFGRHDRTRTRYSVQPGKELF